MKKLLFNKIVKSILLKVNMDDTCILLPEGSVIVLSLPLAHCNLTYFIVLLVGKQHEQVLAKPTTPVILGIADEEHRPVQPLLPTFTVSHPKTRITETPLCGRHLTRFTP